MSSSTSINIEIWKLVGSKSALPSSQILLFNFEIKSPDKRIGLTIFSGYAICPCFPSIFKWPPREPLLPILAQSATFSDEVGSPTRAKNL